MKVYWEQFSTQEYIILQRFFCIINTLTSLFTHNSTFYLLSNRRMIEPFLKIRVRSHVFGCLKKPYLETGSLGTDGFHELDQTPCFSQHILSPLRWGSPPGPVCSGGHRLPRPRAATGMSAYCSCHHLPLQPVHLPLPAFPTAKSYQATACPSACDWKPQRALERECWKHARGGVWERRDLGSSHISM